MIYLCEHCGVRKTPCIHQRLKRRDKNRDTVYAKSDEETTPVRGHTERERMNDGWAMLDDDEDVRDAHEDARD